MNTNLYIYKRIVQAKMFIDANFTEAIDLENIADEAHFSKFHFIRLFKGVYGKTPHQYLISVRLDQAQQLLQQGMSVGQACTAVGFESITSFTGLFRRHTRVTPSEFRRLYFERAQQIKLTPLSFVPACFSNNNGWA